MFPTLLTLATDAALYPVDMSTQKTFYDVDVKGSHLSGSAIRTRLLKVGKLPRIPMKKQNAGEDWPTQREVIHTNFLDILRS